MPRTDSTKPARTLDRARSANREDNKTAGMDQGTWGTAATWRQVGGGHGAKNDLSETDCPPAAVSERFNREERQYPCGPLGLGA